MDDIPLFHVTVNLIKQKTQRNKSGRGKSRTNKALGLLVTE